MHRNAAGGEERDRAGGSTAGHEVGEHGSRDGGTAEGQWRDSGGSTERGAGSRRRTRVSQIRRGDRVHLQIAAHVVRAAVGRVAQQRRGELPRPRLEELGGKLDSIAPLAIHFGALRRRVRVELLLARGAGRERAVHAQQVDERGVQRAPHRLAPRRELLDLHRWINKE